ncbi:NAD(P)/FAD-dependent oxidoreductase [Roseomonas sp. 18066]|uniref:flavin monoamine oxidase family protein n=1 Tax=Roseomonas sp. 18066 TaxID=2681412 RepID=UPI001359F52C|nr:NAD(P)/FAD-dependent oxidoreductase [Roseomonas sp. 18066]
MTQVDVLVVGAGAAGIAAARAVRAAGRSLLVLEARDRAGGRARTDRTTLGAPFDLGATWLHEAGANPLTPLAAGAAPFDHDTVRSHRCCIGDRLATPEEVADYDAAYGRFHAILARQRGPGRSAGAGAPRGGPWDATVAHWEGEVICAAPLDAMDLDDFLDTQLSGPNLLLPGGLGPLLQGLAADLPLRFGAVVERIDWGGARIAVEGNFGRVEARAVVVTIPTSLLAAGAIRFDPPLPAATLQAAHDLPLGLLSKIGLKAAGPDRLDLPDFGGLERQVADPADPAMSFVAWPFGQDHVMGFLGGDAAWALSGQGVAPLLDHALAELRRAYGGRADRAIRADVAAMHDWGADPFARGSYSHARPGRAGARRVLGTPLQDGRLGFAGEACHPRYAATLAGAWDSGLSAAAAALHATKRDSSGALMPKVS